MKVLIVLAHPERRSFSGGLVDVATETLNLAGHEVEIDDLYGEGFDPVFGARPLKRFIQREVETRIGRALIRGDILPGGTIRIDFQDGSITVSTK